MNNLGRLNDTLHEQLERLNEISIEDTNLEKEIARSRAIGDIAKNIISNGNLVLQARRFEDDKIDIDKETPRLLEE